MTADERESLVAIAHTLSKVVESQMEPPEVEPDEPEPLLDVPADVETLRTEVVGAKTLLANLQLEVERTREEVVEALLALRDATYFLRETAERMDE